MPTYILGVLTIPAAIGAGWLLWQGCRLANRVGRAVLDHVPPGNATNQALFGAVAASSRRVHLVEVGGATFAVALGYDRARVDLIRAAIYREIGPPPPRVLSAEERAARRAAGVTTDSGIDFTEED